MQGKIILNVDSGSALAKIRIMIRFARFSDA